MNEFIGKTKMKQWFREAIKPFLKSYEFSFKPLSGVQAIISEKKDLYNFIYITVDWDNHISFSEAIISYKKVEELLYEITKKEVYNGNSNTLRVCFENKKTTVVYVQQDVINLAETFKKVFIDYYLPAFEYYNNPKNVLDFWDSLSDEGKTNHFFDPLNYVKIIILSKMYQEVQYQKRCGEAINFYESKISQGKLSWNDELSHCKKVIKYLEENQI